MEPKQQGDVRPPIVVRKSAGSQQLDVNQRTSATERQGQSSSCLLLGGGRTQIGIRRHSFKVQTDSDGVNPKGDAKL